MNKDRRKRIQSVIININMLLSEIKSEEEIAFDNMPENLQYSMRGEESEEAIGIMDEVVDLLSEAANKLEEI